MIRGLVLPNMLRNIIIGMDWLRNNKPIVDWDTSVLTLKQNGVGFQVYPNSIDRLQQDTVFVRIIEHKDAEPTPLGAPKKDSAPLKSSGSPRKAAQPPNP